MCSGISTGRHVTLLGLGAVVRAPVVAHFPLRKSA